ncbi:MAG: hypothetical protein IH991_08480 [Planctomycetes bacterium]|nr:hypothetical protein [Planctomycetota bacterium]
MDLTPHTPKWFDELRRRNPKQAEHTKQLVAIAGHDKICSMCGIPESRTYRTVAEPTITLRLCHPCRQLQKHLHGLSVDALD